MGNKKTKVYKVTVNGEFLVDEFNSIDDIKEFLIMTASEEKWENEGPAKIKIFEVVEEFLVEPEISYKFVTKGKR